MVAKNVKLVNLLLQDFEKNDNSQEKLELLELKNEIETYFIERKTNLKTDVGLFKKSAGLK